VADFFHQLDIAAPPDTVRELIAARGDRWWTTNAVINPEVGGINEFRFPAAGFHATVRVVTNSPGTLEWHCLDSANPPSFRDRHDWIGSTIRFILEPTTTGTHVRLEHRGLGESAEFYRTKSNVWGFYLESLRKLAESGRGDPYQGGRPGTRTEGLVAELVSFRIKPGKIDTAIGAIQTFIDHIEKHEPETLVYRSYRDGNDSNAFFHYMIFKDEAAHKRHRESEYCKAFVGVLYPCCEAPPQMFALSLNREAAIGAEVGG
jgi:quinol monooxygenase YgiN